MYMSAQEANTVYQSRDERLADFIQSHPMLEDAETRSVFLLGALVGRIAAYQYSDGVSQKLTEQYPPSAVNRRSLPDITQDVLDRNYTYGDKEDIARFNRRYTDRLTDSMLMKRPDDWEMSESETKWVYSLGIAYGKQDTGEGIESEDGIDTETAQ
jgi:CRISPR-associated protein Cas8b/Csh1 subtype I-B